MSNTFECERCHHTDTDAHEFVMHQGEQMLCRNIVACEGRQQKPKEKLGRFFITVPKEPELREYTEMTLHMKGGTKVTAAVLTFEFERSKYGEGFTRLSWEHAPWDDLPKLSAVDLPELQAITTVKVSVVK